MATGAGERYWDKQRLPGKFKHTLLTRYVPRFAGMTGSHAREQRVVFLDGYAGRGRYDGGEPASAEHIMKIARDQRKAGLAWTCFFVEKDAGSAEALAQVVAEYAADGVDARAYRKDVREVLDDVLAVAAGRPLFLFLDPCGLGLPYDALVQLLTERRKDKWPPTEVLLNFSLHAVRRIGGHVASSQGNEAARRRLDEALGGGWWRDHLSAGVTADAVAAIAEQFRCDLARDTAMSIVPVPVRDAPTHKPVYHLVFGTRSPHGLWVFGDSVARAMEAWWDRLEEDEAERDPALILEYSMVRPKLDAVEGKAVRAVAENLARLLDQYPSFKVVDHTLDVFGDYYGQIREPVVRQAVRLLYEQGRSAYDGRGVKRVYDLRVARPSR